MARLLTEPLTAVAFSVVLTPTDATGESAVRLSHTIVEQFARPIVVSAREIYGTTDQRRRPDDPAGRRTARVDRR